MALAHLFVTETSYAGGGSESTLVVVNSRSEASRTIANYFCELRQIPDQNVVVLDYEGPSETIGVEAFRIQILKPILDTIRSRQLLGQIDCIAYSAGFPYAVNFTADVSGPVDKVSGSVGSITGLTYHHKRVMTRDASYVFSAQHRKTNFYQSSLTRAFHSSDKWSPTGQRVATGGESYLLSVMLGYTEGRGNTVDEVVRYLSRSALADGARPEGTVYLMTVNNEVRSSTRDRVFPQIAATLRQLGVSATIEQGVLPSGKPDVMGTVVGRAKFDWAKSRSRILPGAICENLTSFGGILRGSASQTPLTEFLRYGAAGSSGTVMEPYSLQEKFPHPWIHVHYARGASLAEAFFQSVAAPYQLLVVGDPLCQPFAQLPDVTIEGLASDTVVSGSVPLRPDTRGDMPVREYRFFVDGRIHGQCRPGETFTLETDRLAEGYHRLALVAYQRSPTQSQGRLLVPFFVRQQGQIEAAVDDRPSSDGALRLTVRAPECRTIYVFQRRRLLAQWNHSEGTLALRPAQTGLGPVRLRVVGIHGKNGDKVFAPPVQLWMER